MYHRGISRLVEKEKLYYSVLFLLFIFGGAGSSMLCANFSLVAGSWGYSLVAVLRLLIVVTSLVVQYGFQELGFSGSLWHTTFIAPRHKNLPRTGIERMSPALAGGF